MDKPIFINDEANRLMDAVDKMLAQYNRDHPPSLKNRCRWWLRHKLLAVLGFE